MNARVAILTVASAVLFCASHLQAQQSEQLNASIIPASAIPDGGISDANSATAPTLAIYGEPSPADSAAPPDPQGGGAPPATPSDNDDKWHLSVSPYLYFPGVHGTVGAFGRDVGFKASAGDLLSHFRFGIMGLAEARRNRILTSVDLMYMRLGESNALPFPALAATSANLTANLVVLTPKVGFRLIDQPKIKADFLTGIRYWYFGENLNFSPPILFSGLNFSKSQSWVDPLVGGRITGTLAPKVVATIAGDVGGWGTGSQLEYQVFGALGYKLKPNMTLQAGYRYMYFDYQSGGRAGAIVDTALSGVIFGATINLK